MDFINSIFDFFTDKTRALPQKSILGLVLITLILLIDNTFSFSYYYNTDKKIGQIERLNLLLKDRELTPKDQQILFGLKEKIINRETLKEKIWNTISNMDLSFEKTVISEETKGNTRKRRSYKWHFISSSWIILLIMITIPIAGIFSKEGLIKVIGVTIITEPILFSLAWGLAKVFYFIPVISNTPVYNYILNWTLCSIIITIWGIAIHRSQLS